MNQYHFTLIVMLLFATLVGCGADPLQGVDSPEALTLYSIDGRDFEPGQEPETKEKFLSYPVLGKLEITDAEERKEIIAALKNGITDSDGTMAKCFWPRHAIRASQNGETIDYVICFECYQLEIHSNGASKTEPTTRKPQIVLNRRLKNSNIPLAPGMTEAND